MALSGPARGADAETGRGDERSRPPGNSAGGWPTHGFSQSSGIHDVWNLWIIYPLIAWVLATAAHAWFVYGHKPISESEIRREIERQAGGRR